MPNLLTYVGTIQHLNCGGQESQKQFAVYDSSTPVTLKQGQGQQTWYDLVDPKQGYNNTKLEKPHLNSVPGKANNNVFVKAGNTSIMSLEYVQQLEIVAYS